MSASQAATEGEPLEKYGEWREALQCRKTGDVRLASNAVCCFVLLTFRLQLYFDMQSANEHVCDLSIAQ